MSVTPDPAPVTPISERIRQALELAVGQEALTALLATGVKLHGTELLADVPQLLTDALAEIERLQAVIADRDAMIELDEAVLGGVWLHIDWRYVTSKLTTPERERFADAVAEWSARLNDVENEPHEVDRWWRS